MVERFEVIRAFEALIRRQGILRQNMLFLFVRWSETVHLVRRSPLGLLYQPRVIDDYQCGAVGGMRIWKWKP
jgi:hypothetical protein